MGDTGKGPNVRPGPRKRTNTGCITCRIRRVKCDETRPTCNKCALSKRVCDGYLPETSSQLGSFAAASNDHAGGNETSINRTKPISRRALAVAIRQLNAVGPTARVLAPSPYLQDAVACFDFFRFRVTAASHAQRDSPQTMRGFWSCSLLQIAHLEPAVWHAVAALGALHRKWEVASNPRAPHPLPALDEPQPTAREGLQLDQHDARESDLDSAARVEADLQSLRLNDQASSCYTKALGLAKSIHDPITLLVLSVALGTASNIAGRWAERNVHIQAGQRIMAQLCTSPSRSEVEIDAEECLSKLALQWVTFSEQSAPYPFTEEEGVVSTDTSSSQRSDILTEGPGSIFHKAKLVLIRTSQRILSAAGAVDMQETQVADQARSGRDKVPRTELEKSISQDIQRWEFEMAHFLAINPVTALGTTLELLSIKLLHTAVRLFMAVGVMSTAYNELDWDEHLAHFERLVALIALLFQEEAEANPLLPPITSLDEPSVNVCLWLVAHRCRHPLLRRRAVGLLRGVKRLEGAWMSTSTSEGAAKIIKVEEGGEVMSPSVVSAFGRDWTDVEAVVVQAIQEEEWQPGSWLRQDARWLTARTSWVLRGEAVVPLWRRVADTDVSADLDARAGMSKATLVLTFADRGSDGRLRKETVTVRF